jgi:hypothetical protein
MVCGDSSGRGLHRGRGDDGRRRRAAGALTDGIADGLVVTDAGGDDAALTINCG